MPGVEAAGGFEEAHSHATSHLLLPEDPRLLAGSGPLVLVDDEFSTGNTVLNTIRDLHARHPRPHYVVVALVDMRSAADRDRLTAFAAELGARVDLIALASGTVSLPDGVLDRGRALVEEYEAQAEPHQTLPLSGSGAPADGPGGAPAAGPQPVTRVDLHWPAGFPTADATASPRPPHGTGGRSPRAGRPALRRARHRTRAGPRTRQRGADVRAAAPRQGP